MRLQSHFDGTPVCLIRYRLTQKAAGFTNEEVFDDILVLCLNLKCTFKITERRWDYLQKLSLDINLNVHANLILS